MNTNFSGLTEELLKTMTPENYSSVSSDSRKLQPGCIFVAVRGGTTDGHQYLAQAIAAGAKALVVESRTAVPADLISSSGCLVIEVMSSRIALNQIAAVYYGRPANQLFCVGVTGTNGKTTTVYLIEAILNKRGWPTGVIGTIDHHLRSGGSTLPQVWKTEMTTPDPVAFQQRLAEFVKLGANALAMEVSSHAIDQHRVDEVPFDTAVFTNLSRDHLDYHGTMENYFLAKKKLFSDLLGRSSKSLRTAIINEDDEYGRKLLHTPAITTWTYGSGGSADLRFEILKQDFGGTHFHLRTPFGDRDFHVRMPGLHNVYNATAAIGVGLTAGANLDVIADALDSFTGVPGRLESVQNNRGLHVFIDYAHSDDAIRTILHYLNKIRSESKLSGRIITVFGCGGDRDKGKRPLMMKAAAEASDVVILTSDNPRTEDPLAILRDAAAGAEPSALGKKIHQEVDRKKAIAMAIGFAHPGDVIVIAGKGHEDYQIIGTKRFPFSDVGVATELLG